MKTLSEYCEMLLKAKDKKEIEKYQQDFDIAKEDEQDKKTFEKLKQEYHKEMENNEYEGSFEQWINNLLKDSHKA
jgi:hypothetical protein